MACRDHGNRAVYHDVKSDSSKPDDMLKYSDGERRVQVIIDGDNVSVSYRGS